VLLYNWKPVQRVKLGIPKNIKEGKHKSDNMYSFYSYLRLQFVSPTDKSEKTALVRFSSNPEGFNWAGWNETEEQMEDYSFSTEKIKRYASSSTPSCVPPKPPIQKNKEHIFHDILMLSIRSGLKRVNAFEVISKLKTLAFKGKDKINQSEFLAIITGMSKYKCLPLYCLKSMKQYLISFFKNFDSKGRGEVSYRNIGRGLIVLCDGTIQDKVDSIKLLYEEYGIQEIEQSEIADLCEGVFKLYKIFDPRIFEKVGIVEVAAETTNKCWDELKICNAESVKPWQLKKWIERLNVVYTEEAGSLSKVKQRYQLDKLLKESFERLLRNKNLFNFVKVFKVNKY